MTLPRASTRRFTKLLPLILGCLLVLALGWMLKGPGSPTGTSVSHGSAGAASSPALRPTPGDTRDSGLETIAESALPSQARDTLRLIRAGGPFPYRQDGVTFQNRERILPPRALGDYHEYTVKTPGSPDRGPRRIITGPHGDLYWTADHYDHFQQIQEGR